MLSAECIEYPNSITERGYGRPTVNGKRRFAHRLAWEEENGPIPDGMNVLHHCDNPPCVNVDHLFLGDQADNMRDAREKGHRPTARHGTPHMYIHLGCRCSECRADASARYYIKKEKEFAAQR